MLHMDASENICQEQVSVFRCLLLASERYNSMTIVDFCENFRFNIKEEPERSGADQFRQLYCEPPGLSLISSGRLNKFRQSARQTATISICFHLGTSKFMKVMLCAGCVRCY